MGKLQKVTLGFWVGVAIAGSITSLPATGQSIIRAADGTRTRVNTQGNLINITGGSASGDGANLFHSFQQLSVPTGITANFIASPNVQNILGRVVGGNPSIINGVVQVTGSNSNLYLINPAGIVFGNNASLNVPATFTATTANQIGFSGNNFLNSFGANNYQNLTGTPNQFVFNTALAGSIINAGNLTLTPGQNLTLLGGAILNTGSLVSSGGTVTIMAVPGTNLVRLSQPGNVLSLELTPPASGVITPLSLPQLLTGNNNVIGITLNPDGTLPFAGFDTPLNRGNTVMTGRINTVNRNGNFPAIPRVQVLGDRIALLNAVINANSVYGGGTVLIGGEYLGQGIIPTAQFTFADTNTRIRANGIGNANGGRVIAWANNTARFFGTINARGGAFGGNGGFIETSGKLSLDISGIRVNASAPFGNPGIWLIDPIDITISNAPTSGGTLSVFGDFFVSDGISPTANILASDIIDTLNAGTNLVITTDQGPSGGNGDITINTALNINPPASGASFTLLAARDININAPIIATGGLLNVDLRTSTVGNISVNGTINTRGGSFFAAAFGGNFAANSQISTVGGNFAVNAQNSFVANNLISTLSTAGNSGSINIRAITGSIATQELRSSNTLSGGVAGSVTLNAPMGISVGTINSSRLGAGSGRGNFINITTDGLFLANDTLTAPPLCVGASLCSFGNAASGNITIQHGGGVVTPFVVGGATNNGTVGGIYSTGLLSAITVPVPPAVNSYLADTITITTTAPPDPSPSPLSSPTPAIPAIAPEILTLLRNPEAPLPPEPVVVGTPPVPDLTPESITNPIPASIPELLPIPSPSPVPILVSNSPNPLPTNSLTTSLETLPPSISLREGYTNAPSTLTREQINQFSRDFQGGQPLTLEGANIPPVARGTTLSEIQRFSTGEAMPTPRDISPNSEVNPAVIYIFFGQPDPTLGKTHEQMRLAVERSSLVPRDDDQLEIVVIFQTGEPIRKTLGLTRQAVVNLVEQFRQEITAYKTNPGAYLEPSQQVYQWLIAPIAPELQARQVNNLNFLLDRELRSLPLAALHNGQGFLVESYSLAMLPPLDQTPAQPEFTGLVMQSEGIFSLASLWDVGEETTLGLMNNFSNHLTTAPLRAEALRRTQLAMLRPQIPTESELSGLGDRNFSHPYFWSAFTLVENPW